MEIEAEEWRRLVVSAFSAHDSLQRCADSASSRSPNLQSQTNKQLQRVRLGVLLLLLLLLLMLVCICYILFSRRAGQMKWLVRTEVMLLCSKASHTTAATQPIVLHERDCKYYLFLIAILLTVP